MRQRLQLRGQCAEVAEEPQADVLLFHGVDSFPQILLQQAHDGIHLIGGPLPVLCGKGVYRQVFHSQFLAVGGDVAEHLCPRLVPHRAGQAAFFRPAAVAVHNNSDMAGKAAPVHLPRRMGRFLRKQSH